MVIRGYDWKPAAVKMWIWMRELFRVLFAVVDGPWKMRTGELWNMGSVVW